MSQRALFVILFAVLFAACEDDTIVSLNAVNFTKSYLRDIAESARHAADQTDILAARLAIFTDSAITFSDSTIAFSDSTIAAALLLAAADYDLRFASEAAYWFFDDRKDESKVIKKIAASYNISDHAYSASKTYEVARRTAFAAYVAAAAAYDARRARLASKAYAVARRTADETVAISRRAARQAAVAKATQAATRVAALQATAAADSLQAAAKATQASAQTASDKATRLRRAYDKDAAAHVAALQAAAAADSLQAAAEVAQTATAARRAAAKAAEAAKVYAAEVARLRRAYDKDAVQAAYDVATAAAYATAYEAYRGGACLAATYAAQQASFGTAYADTNMYRAYGPFDHLAHATCGISSINSKAAIQAARTAYVTYVDSAAYAAAYDAAHVLFNSAYVPNSSDPQAAAAEAYAAEARAAAEAAAAEAARRGKNKVAAYDARIAVRDSAYVTPPISIATAALATSKAAYQAWATHIDSLLNSIE